MADNLESMLQNAMKESRSFTELQVKVSYTFHDECLS